MRRLRDAAAGFARLLVGASAVVSLVLTVAATVGAVQAGTPSRAPLHQSPASQVRLQGTLSLQSGAAAQSRISRGGRTRLARRPFAWRPRLHRSTKPWMQATTHGHHLRAPAPAIVDPSADRWQADVPAAAAPEPPDTPARLLRLRAAHDAPGRAPFLVLSFPRPPPAHA